MVYKKNYKKSFKKRYNKYRGKYGKKNLGKCMKIGKRMCDKTGIYYFTERVAANHNFDPPTSSINAGNTISVRYLTIEDGLTPPMNAIASLLSITLPANPTVPVWWCTLGFSDQFRDMTTHTRYTSMFDSYRIKAVKYTFKLTNYTIVPQYTGATTMGAVLGAPEILIANDYDDNTAPATAANLLERTGVKRFRFMDKNQLSFSHYYKPKTRYAILNDSNAIVGGATNRKESPWIDCASPDIDYFGFKMGILIPAPTNGVLLPLNPILEFMVEKKYYFEVKDKRGPPTPS